MPRHSVTNQQLLEEAVYLISTQRTAKIGDVKHMRGCTRDLCTPRCIEVALWLRRTIERLAELKVGWVRLSRA